MRTTSARKLAPLFLTAVLAACDGGGGFDAGAADVFITHGEDEQPLVHDPYYSLVSTTPPVGGVVTVTFSFQDPQVTVEVEVDSNAVSEGQSVSIPSLDARLDVELDGVLFSSNAAGASGQLSFDVLQVDEAADAAEVIVSFDAHLVTSDGADALDANGSIEGRVGTFPTADDEGAATVNVD